MLIRVAAPPFLKQDSWSACAMFSNFHFWKRKLNLTFLHLPFWVLLERRSKENVIEVLLELYMCDFETSQFVVEIFLQLLRIVLGSKQENKISWVPWAPLQLAGTGTSRLIRKWIISNPWIKQSPVEIHSYLSCRIWFSLNFLSCANLPTLSDIHLIQKNFTWYEFFRMKREVPVLPCGNGTLLFVKAQWSWDLKYSVENLTLFYVSCVREDHANQSTSPVRHFEHSPQSQQS